MLAIEDRAAWIREQHGLQLVLAGEDCGGDSLYHWLQATNVVRARPHVCYNHLRCRRRLEAALGGRTVDFEEPLPEFAMSEPARDPVRSRTRATGTKGANAASETLCLTAKESTRKDPSPGSRQ